MGVNYAIYYINLFNLGIGSKSIYILLNGVNDMKYYYDEKTNTFYINTKLIMPETKKFNEIKNVFKMSYIERINKFCPVKNEIMEQIKKYENCKISEFTNIY